MSPIHVLTAELSDSLDGILEAVKMSTRLDSYSQRLSDDVVRLMKPKGFFSLLLPAELGGTQLNYPEYIDLLYKVAAIDGSTAWCINQGSVLSTLARLVPLTEAREIWSDSGGVVLANGPPAPGRCTSIEREDRYQLTGQWTFSSGISHADWLMGMCVAECRDGSKQPRWHLFPKSAAVIASDWDVQGLRQTGSFSFTVDELDVPKTRVFEYAVQQDDLPLYQIPLNLLFAGGFSAVALGVARSAIDFAIERSGSKIRRFGQHVMRDEVSTQDGIGRAEARWQSASSYLDRAVMNAWEATIVSGQCAANSKYELRLASTHGIREAKAVVDLVYDLCSTDSIHGTELIQRQFQDIHVISQHLQGRPEIYALVGKHKLGIRESSFLVD